jgi:hypothetical protein
VPSCHQKKPGKRLLRAASAFVLLSAAQLTSSSYIVHAQTPYTVTQNRVASAMQPNVSIDVDSSSSYVGSQRFILYGVAQAEQHLFVERRGGAVARFLWIQFEEYLPSSSSVYNYSRSPVFKRFGRDFHVDGALRKAPQTETRPESDGARARGLLREKGITLPEDVLYHRLVWLPTSRSEVMLIYMESLESQKLRLAELQSSAAADSALTRTLAAHRDRAFSAFRIRP